MKIIKEGNLPKEKIYRGNCYNCHSVIEAKKEELKIEHDQKENNEFASAMCPFCKDNIIIFYPKVKR